MPIALGIDTGGTYTDAVLVNQSSGDVLATTKALTTHRDLAIALVEAGTCEPEGYLAEKAKGYVKVLPPGEQFRCEFQIGALSPDDALYTATKINALISASRG